VSGRARGGKQTSHSAFKLSMETRIPPQYTDQDITARNRDVVLRWLDGASPKAIAPRYNLVEGEVEVILESPEGKRIREEIRSRAVEQTLERFDTATPRSLEELVRIRDTSEDEETRRKASLDILSFSSIKKKSESEGNMGVELVKLTAQLAKDLAEKKE